MKKYALGIFGLAIIPAVWFIGVLTSTPSHINPLMPEAGFATFPVGVLCMIITGARLGKTWPRKLLFVGLAVLISVVDIWLTMAFSLVLVGAGIA